MRVQARLELGGVVEQRAREKKRRDDQKRHQETVHVEQDHSDMLRVLSISSFMACSGLGDVLSPSPRFVAMLRQPYGNPLKMKARLRGKRYRWSAQTA